MGTVTCLSCNRGAPLRLQPPIDLDPSGLRPISAIAPLLRLRRDGGLQSLPLPRSLPRDHRRTRSHRPLPRRFNVHVRRQTARRLCSNKPCCRLPRLKSGEVVAPLPARAWHEYGQWSYSDLTDKWDVVLCCSQAACLAGWLLQFRLNWAHVFCRVP